VPTPWHFCIHFLHLFCINSALTLRAVFDAREKFNARFRFVCQQFSHAVAQLFNVVVFDDSALHYYVFGIFLPPLSSNIPLIRSIQLFEDSPR